MLHIIWSIIIGFFIGLVARALLPGAQHMGFFATAILGIVGSVIGGVIGMLISKPAPGQKFHPAGFILSVICAMVALWLYIRMG